MPADPEPDVLPEDEDGHRMRRTYAAVLLIEAGVLLALWGLGRYFGS